MAELLARGLRIPAQGARISLTLWGRVVSRARRRPSRQALARMDDASFEAFVRSKGLLTMTDRTRTGTVD